MCCVLVVVGLINRVDTHITSDEPDENEEREHSIKERIALVKAPALYDAAHSY